MDDDTVKPPCQCTGCQNRRFMEQLGIDESDHEVVGRLAATLKAQSVQSTNLMVACGLAREKADRFALASIAVLLRSEMMQKEGTKAH